MSDPASLNVAVGIVGLGLDEALAVVANIPAGTSFDSDVIKPAIGGKRFAIRARGLSVAGAKDLTNALYLHVKAVEVGGAS